MNRRHGLRSEELLHLARLALDRGDLADAEAYGRRALMFRADSVEARHLVAGALIEQSRFDEAAELLERILEADPEHLPALADLGVCLFEMFEFEDAEAVLARALEVEPADAQTCYWMAQCVERRGHFRQADEYFQLAYEQDPDSYPMPIRLDHRFFERLLLEAIDELPEEIKDQLDGLKIIATDLPRIEDLIESDPPAYPGIGGLYVGTPLPERAPGEHARTRDTIYVYRRNLERTCRDRETLVQDIRATLLHEIGHYLGVDDDELVEHGLG